MMQEKLRITVFFSTEISKMKVEFHMYKIPNKYVGFLVTFFDD